MEDVSHCFANLPLAVRRQNPEYSSGLRREFVLPAQTCSERSRSRHLLTPWQRVGVLLKPVADAYQVHLREIL